MSDLFALKKQFPELSWSTLNALAAAQGVDKEAACARVATGYPLAYLLNKAPFGPTELFITEPLLIPRPETWDWLSQILPRLAPGPKALDLGCGPGTIGWALGAFFPKHFDLLSVDIELQAQECLNRNLDPNLFLSKHFRISDWFSEISKSERFDLIVSNPPYCADTETGWMENTNYESAHALFAPHGGLACYHSILSGAAQHLNTNGNLLLEHGAGQGAAIVALLCHHGFQRWAPIYDTMGAWRATWVKRQ